MANHETTSPLKDTVYGSITGRLGYITADAFVQTGTTTVGVTTSATPGASTSPATAGLTTSTRTTTANGTATKFLLASLSTVTTATTASAFRTQFSTGSTTVSTTTSAAGDVLPTPPFFFDSATGGSGSTNGGTTSSTVVMPTGVVADDFAIIIHSNGTQEAYTATPSGFTELTGTGLTTGQGLVVGTSHQVTVWYKILDGTEDGTTYTISTSAASYKATALVVYRGVNTTLPFNAWELTTDAAGTTITFPAVTPPNSYTTIVRATGTERSATGATYTHTPPTGATDRADYASSRANQLNVGVEVNDELGPTTLATTFASETGSSSASTVAGNFTFALSPIKISEEFFADGGAVTITPTTTASGYVTKSVTAGLTTVSLTSTADGTNPVSVTAGTTTVTTTTTAVTGASDNITTAGPVTVASVTTAAAGSVTKPSTAGTTTVTTTTSGTPGASTSPVTAGGTTVTATTTASAGATTKPSTADTITVTSTTAADSGAVTKPSAAGTTTVDVTTTAEATSVRPTAWDAHALSAANYTSTGTQTTSITVGSDARGALVVIAQDNSTADEISSVTFNGVEMGRPIPYDTDDTENGAVYVYFLDDITGQGTTVDVAMTTTGSSSKRLQAHTINVAPGKAVGVVANSNYSPSDANPTVTFSGLDDTKAYLGAFAVMSGLTTMTSTPGAGWSSDYYEDLGQRGRALAYLTNPTFGVTSIDAVWTAATADDYVIIGAVVTETAIIRSTTAGTTDVAPTTTATANVQKWLDADTTTVTTTTEGTPGATVKPVTAGLTTVTSTTSASGLDEALRSAGAVTVTATATANAGSSTKPVTTGTTTVSAATTANADVARATTAGAVTVSPTTTATPAGTTKPGTASTTVSLTSSANGYKEAFVTAGPVVVTATTTGTPEPASDLAVAGPVTVTTVTTAAAGAVTKPVTAGQTTVTSSTTAAAGAVTKPVTAGTVTVTATTTAVPGLAADETPAGLVTVGTTASATASVTKFVEASTTVTPTTDANAIAWRTMFLRPDAILSMTNLTGTVSDIQDSPTAPDGNGLVATAMGIDVRFSFENPGYQLRTNTGDQKIRVLVTSTP